MSISPSASFATDKRKWHAVLESLCTLKMAALYSNPWAKPPFERLESEWQLDRIRQLFVILVPKSSSCSKKKQFKPACRDGWSIDPPVFTPLCAEKRELLGCAVQSLFSLIASVPCSHTGIYTITEWPLQPKRQQILSAARNKGFYSLFSPLEKQTGKQIIYT